MKDQEKTKEQRSWRKNRGTIIVVLSVIAGLSFWVIDAAIDSAVFYEEGFWDSLIFTVSGSELYMRIGAALTYVIFGIVVSIILSREQGAEEKLRESEAMLSLAQNVAHIGNWSWNLQTNELFWSEENYRILGIPPDVSPSYEVFEKTIHPEDREFVNKNVKDALEKNRPHDVNFRIILPDNSERIVNAVGKVFYDKEDRPLRFFGTIQDITKRKQAEEKLRVQSLALGERVKELNCLYGISKLVEKPDITLDEIIQGTIDLIPPSWQYPEITCARAIIDGLKFETMPFRETSWKQSSEIKIFNKQSGILEVFYMEEKPEIDKGPFLKEERSLIDAVVERLGRITERRRAEAELKRYSERLEEMVEERTRELREAQEKLKRYSERLEEMVEERTRELREAQESLIRGERLAVLGQLAGGVGHELRNPLGVITNAVYYLKSVHEGADEKTQECLEMISSEVRNAEKIVADLLNLSRTKPTEAERTAVSDLISEALERASVAENIEVEVDVPEGLPEVFIDPQQMRQVLINLITNACQAMEEGGGLSVRARAVGERVEVAVSDTGCGISGEDMEKIFEPLFTTKPSGIGLGLAVSKNLLDVNGASIEVESEEGRGSIFTVILPTLA